MLTDDLYQNLIDVANQKAVPNPNLIKAGLCTEDGKLTAQAEQMLASSQMYVVPHIPSSSMNEQMAIQLLESGYTVHQAWMSRGVGQIAQPGKPIGGAPTLHDIWIPPRKNMIPVQGLIAMFIAHAQSGGDLVTLNRLCTEITGQKLEDFIQK